MKVKPLLAAVHVMALFSLAVAQPLYDMLAQNVEFFLVRRTQPIDVLLILGVLAVGFPILLFLATRLLIRPRWVWGGHLTLITLLAAILALPALNSLGVLNKASGWGVLAAALLVGAGFAACYARYTAIRSLTTWLAAGVVVLPGYFLHQSDLVRLLGNQGPPAFELGPVQTQSPIVMIVFDELSLITLLDEHRQIDAIRYPNFAALAQDATWFRNATTNHQSTSYAVPAILTGKRSPQQAKPGLADHPGNLFTLLRGQYDLRVFEPYTQLCPNELLWKAPARPGVLDRLAALGNDLGLLQLHLLTPRSWTAALPDIASLDLPSCCSSQRTRPPRLEHFEQYLEALEPTNRPALYFIHNVNPHSPHSNFPSGRRYLQESGWPEGVSRTGHMWGDDLHLIHQGQQRHLLQVGLVDRLLGRAVARLKELDLYDQALIVVVADHGVSYTPRESIRFIDEANAADIARIPFLVKRPHQHVGTVDDSNVQIIDVLPTIADVQGFAIPWKTDGVSAFLSADQKPGIKTIDRYHGRYEGASERVLDARLAGDFGSLDRKLALFGSGPLERIFAYGACPDLHGRPVADVAVAEPVSIQVRLDPAKAGDVADPLFVPAFFKGEIQLDAEKDRDIALAVNGVIRATVPVRNRGDGTGRLMALVPEECLSSRNQVEFFAIETRRGQPCLRPTLTRLIVPEDVMEPPAGPEPEPVLLKDLALTPKALQGSVDIVHVSEDCLVFDGWAADLPKGQLSQSVMLFLDGRLVAEGRTPVARPDVVAALQKPFLKDAGFSLKMPLAAVPKKGRPKFQVVAVGADGVAAELPGSSQYREALQQLPVLRRRP